jgi:6-pyruvoyltetrahydropterin/6-carboxytetrahydropterin synthase
MQTVRITKEFRFESAHALTRYDGKCRHIHGHSYILYVTVKGIPICDADSPKDGMLMDFTDLKAIINDNILGRYDHSLIMCEGSPLSEEISEYYGNVITVPFRPTCENLVIHFASLINDALKSKSVTLYSLRLHETASSYAEWFADDNISY